MNREQKLSLIVGFTVILLVGILISDHLSGARNADISDVDGDEVGLFNAHFAAGRAEPFQMEEEPETALTLDTIPIVPEVATAEELSPPAPLELDQSGGDDHVSLLSEVADRGGRILRQGTELILDLPGAVTPLAKTDEPEFVWHTVAEDDTLWQLADRYLGSGAKWQSIVDQNKDRIDDTGRLRIGVRLQIPNATNARQQAPAKAAPPASDRTYIVRAGDTISEISLALLGTCHRYREILDLNRDTITSEDMVREGVVLKIPAK